MAVEVQELHCDSPDTSLTPASAADHPDPGKKMKAGMCSHIIDVRPAVQGWLG